MKKSEDDCLIATESKMGWLISGPISKEFESDHTNAMLSLEIHQDEGEKVDEILTKFWEISSVPKTNKDNGNAVHANLYNLTRTRAGIQERSHGRTLQRTYRPTFTLKEEIG